MSELARAMAIVWPFGWRAGTGNAHRLRLSDGKQHRCNSLPTSPGNRVLGIATRIFVS